MARGEQRWILDTLLGSGGLDILHPGSQGIFEQFGYDWADIRTAFAKANASTMLTKAWSEVAEARERRFEFAVERGFEAGARAMALRAGLLFGRAQYTILADVPRKRALHAKMCGLYDEVITRNPTKIERVTVDLEGKKVYGILHLPADTSKPSPCVLLIPGMDMFKEEWHQTAQKWLVTAGMAVLALDGPGQGETRLNGLAVTETNFEAAASRVIDHLVADPRIDAERIGVMGISMGSYFASRIAATDSRIRAAATSLSCYALDNMMTIFNYSQPKYKSTFMYMAAVDDEAVFDRDFTMRMRLQELAPKITCPALMIAGEFDELTPLADTIGVFDLVGGPKELWIYEDEFHPLGPVAGEMLPMMSDWMHQRLTESGTYANPRTDRVLVRLDGSLDAEHPVLNAYRNGA